MTPDSERAENAVASFSKVRSKAEDGLDVEEVLGELEHKIERVKIIYEQYFMGIEKLEPQTARKEITRKLLELTQLQIRNTALRYRFHALNQKFGAYVAYWNRTLREIENGTYYRSIARAGRDAARKGVEVPDEVLRALPKRLRDRIMHDRDRLADRAAAGSGPTSAHAAEPPAAAGSFDTSFEELFESAPTERFASLATALLTTRRPAG